MPQSIDRILVVGLGAVGAPYAYAIKSARPDVHVAALVSEETAWSYRNDPITVNGRAIDIAIANETACADPMSLVIVAVKRPKLDPAIQSIKPFVGPDTQIISLLNGIDSEELLAGRYGWQRVLYSTCVGMDSHREGHAITTQSLGRILLGEACNAPVSPRVERIREFLDGCGIPIETPRDMLREIWCKLMVNVGMNQVSAVLGLPYGPFRVNKQAMAWMKAAQLEVIAVAKAEGIAIDETDIDNWEKQLSALSESGMSSMLQDMNHHRLTEVDGFGGVILHLGRKHGIQTPINEMLVDQIRRLESAYSASPRAGVAAHPTGQMSLSAYRQH